MSDNYAEMAVRISLENRAYLEKLLETQTATKKFGDDSRKSFGEFGEFMKSFGVPLAGMAAITEGAHLLVDQLKDCAKAAMQAETNQVRLNSALLATHNVSGQTRTSINEYADQLSKASTFSKQSIIQIETDLLKFTNIRGEVFKQATQMSLNIAARTGKEANEVADSMGRALENPAKAQRILKQVGAELTDSQQKMVEQMLAANDVAGAQGIIMQNLATFQGAASAETQTTAGRMKILQNRFEEIKEEIGKGMLPALDDVTIELTKTAESSDSAAESFGKMTGGIIKGVSEIVKGFKNQWNTSIIGLTNNLAFDLASGEGLNSFSNAGKRFAEAFGYKFKEEISKDVLKSVDEAAYQAAMHVGGAALPGTSVVPTGPYAAGTTTAQPYKQSPEAAAAARKYEEMLKQRQAYLDVANAPTGIDQWVAKQKEKEIKAFQDLSSYFENSRHKDEALEKAHQDQLNKIDAEGAAKKINLAEKTAQTVFSGAEKLGNAIIRMLNQQYQQQQQSLENQQRTLDAAIDYMTKKEEEAAGVSEETAEQKTAKSIALLERQLKQETNLKNKKIIQEQLNEKRAEEERLQLQKKAADEKHAVEVLEAFRKNKLAEKAFKTNQDYQYATTAINMAAGISAGIAAAWATSLTHANWYEGVALMAVSTALTTAADAVELGMISKEHFVPTYASGTWDVDRDQLALIHEHEKIISAPFAKAVDSGEAVISSGPAGAGVHVHFHGPVYESKAAVLKSFKEVFNFAGIKMAHGAVY